MFSLAFLAILSSCSNVDDDNEIISEVPQTEKPYQNGVLMSNEGNFGSSNADISFIKEDFSVVSNKIFALNNNNLALGDVAQYIGFHNDLAFVVMNNSNTIQIVNRYTFKKINQITENLNQPRAIAFANEKIYVTNANSKTVTIYNASNYAFVKSIDLNFQPEKLVSTTNYVYVQTSNYAAGNVVEIINTATDLNTSDLNFSSAMNGVTLDKSTNSVYVIGSDANNTQISKIVNTEISKTITNSAITNSRFLTFDNNQLYFTSGTGIYTISPDLTNFPEASMFNVSDNSWSTLYGFDVINGKVYSSDANSFTQNSIITIYNLSGSVLKTFSTEIGTNGFYKN